MKSHFLKLEEKLDKFQAEKFLISGYLMAKNSGCSFLYVSFFMRVLTVYAKKGKLAAIGLQYDCFHVNL